MQSKWRAPACYVGVAIICALYLAVVPGVSITDIAAGAGLGAAVMWAINEWETGKWNVVVPGTALAATPAVATAVAAAPVAAPPAASAAAATPAEPVAQTTAATPDLEPRQRVDSGVATSESLAKWEVDEKEPSWDPNALAETWAKLRRELSINRPSRPAVAPDLPRTAQLAKGPIGRSAPGLPSSKPLSSSTNSPAKPQLGSLSKTYAANQRTSSTQGGYSSGTSSSSAKPNLAKPSYSSGHSGTSAASSSSSSLPPRKVANASEPARPALNLRLTRPR